MVAIVAGMSEGTSHSNSRDFIPPFSDSSIWSSCVGVEVAIQRVRCILRQQIAGQKQATWHSILGLGGGAFDGQVVQLYFILAIVRLDVGDDVPCIFKVDLFSNGKVIFQRFVFGSDE